MPGVIAIAGDRRSGGIHVLYDTSFSERGALLCVARAPRRASPFDFIPPLLIKTPHSLPMFREEPTRKRQRDKDSKVSQHWVAACKKVPCGCKVADSSEQTVQLSCCALEMCAGGSHNNCSIAPPLGLGMLLVCAAV